MSVKMYDKNRKINRIEKKAEIFFKKKLSETCQKVVKKLSKSCQNVHKKFTKSWQKVVKKLVKIMKRVGGEEEGEEGGEGDL
jgi:hypothetical protein